MTFPSHDGYWTSTADFVVRHLRSDHRVIVPAEFSARIPGSVAAHPWLTEPLDGFQWVVVHKGRLDDFNSDFLRAASARFRPVFSNEVFVVFTSDGGPPSVTRDDLHLSAFNAKLRALKSTRPRDHHPIRASFDLQPYVRPVPDPVLRLDPRAGLNQLCDISDWRDGPMLHYLAELHQPVRIHRKAWEFGKCLAGLDRLGAVRSDATGLSVGAGTEAPMFYLANHVDRMVAADLYEDQEGIWGWEANFIEHPEKYASFPFRRESLEVRNMSGLDLQFPDSSFDFVYTLSSIEHFGGHHAADRAMQEMARVTKPGGVVCVATELLLSTDVVPDFFTLPELEEHVIGSTDLRLVEAGLDLRISESLLAYPAHIARDSPGVSPHIVVTGHPDTHAAWTSIILFFRK